MTTEEQIDQYLVMFPNHSRTSCSDADPGNYYTTPGRGGAPRCVRCALLHAKSTGDLEAIEVVLRADVLVTWE